MKNRLFLMFVILMLTMLMPAPITAAPLAERETILTVGAWNVSAGLEAGYITFAASDINWQAQQGDLIYFGYIIETAAYTSLPVEVVVKLRPQIYPYPQHLDLEGNYQHYLTPSTACTLTQFVRILNKSGDIAIQIYNGPYDYCVAAMPYP